MGSVTSFAIDDQARFKCGSDHALLTCEIGLSGKHRIKWKYNEAIHYNFKQKTCFKKYQISLDNSLNECEIGDFKKLTLDDKLKFLTEKINSCAMSTFGVNCKKRKKGLKLPKPIIA